MSELEAAVKVGQEKVDELAKNRAEAIRTFRLLVTKASTLIEDKHPAIKQHSKNCKSIPRRGLRARLPRARENRWPKRGEDPFPGLRYHAYVRYLPRYPDTAPLHRGLSESQKEFIDLAFRIALIRTSSEVGGAMLVLETPEANLDSLFIYNAGDLLRNFANEGGQSGNLLLASSNLNDANMIPALLGIDRHPDTSREEIDRRIINLHTIDVGGLRQAVGRRGIAQSAAGRYCAAARPASCSRCFAASISAAFFSTSSTKWSTMSASLRRWSVRPLM
jgi:hypothetical protein